MNKLKELRMQCGLKQKDLAEKLGTTQQTIARWETGRTMIPTAQLREIAMFFGRSVDELLGVERQNKKRRRSPFAFATHGTPWGTLRAVFSFGHREYPIDEVTKNRLTSSFSEFPGTEDNAAWIGFAALDNRLVSLNPEFVRKLDLVDDNVEEMPDFHHPEVYNGLSNNDFEPGSEFQAKVTKLREELGEDGVLDIIATTSVIYKDGTSEGMYLSDEVATNVLALSGHSFHVPKNAFLEIEEEGSYVSRLVNLSHVASLEVPLEWYLRLTAGDSE